MTIFFDMDGTLNEFYNVFNWLDYLQKEDTTPYVVARPHVSCSVLARYLHKVQNRGYKIGIISWTARNSSEKYAQEVTAAKMQWLRAHLPSVTWDCIHIVEYGKEKQLFKTNCDDILFDDEEKNRDSWEGNAYEPVHIIDVLKVLAAE